MIICYKKNCDYNVFDAWGYQAIHYAAQCINQYAISFLLKAGASVNQPVKDDWGNPPLQIAISYGAFHAAEVLLERGADINQQQKYHWSALHQAVYSANPRAVFLLVERGIDVGLVNDRGVTALEQCERLLIEEPDKFVNQWKLIADFLRAKV